MAALALAGCALVPKSSQPPPQPPEQARPEKPRPEQPLTALPSDETRNRVAVLVPLSGANAGVGTSIANAAQLALLDTGGQGIRITVYDTSRAGGAGAAANEALAQGAGLILGPLLAEDVRAVAPAAHRAGVPVIAFSNDVSVAGDGVYLMGFTPGGSIERVVDYARGRGMARFAAVTPNGVYGERAGRAMREVVEHAGGRLVGMQSYDRDATSLRAAITRVSAQGAYDAILVADSGRIAALAAPMLRGTRILGTELWGTEGDLGRTPALRGAWYATASDVMFDQLRTRYHARYGTNPYRLASLGYDSVLLAIRIAKDWRVGRAFPERLLRDPGGFVGVDGAFRFDGSNIVERALEVREVTAAGSTVLSPAPKGFE
ncbi:MAG TPA: penicillin-binding protein activator [Allosphingosinicella sp.]|nr:penicillin-binding protein activator [Allosphingosinicella sp.]